MSKIYPGFIPSSKQALRQNDTVRMEPIDGSKIWKKATVVSRVEDNPRSYIVQDEEGRKYRRDRQFLRLVEKTILKEPVIRFSQRPFNIQLPIAQNEKEPYSEVAPENQNDVIRTRSGRISQKPKRFVP